MGLLRRTGFDTSQVKDPATKRVFDRMAEMMRVWNGEGRNEGDRVVTVGDLTKGTLDVNLKSLNGVPQRPVGGGVVTPVKPRDFTAMGSYSAVILSWGEPQYHGHAYTEIWRSTSDNLGTAKAVGQAPGLVWADTGVEDATTYYYWIRFISVDGIAGPYHATAGAKTSTGASVEYVREALTTKRWAASTAYGLFRVVSPTTNKFIGNVQVTFQATVAGTSGTAEPDWSTITAFGQTITDGTVTWTAVDVSTAPLVAGSIDGRPMVLMPGAAIEDASIKNAKIKDLAADKLFAVNATVLELLVNSATAHTMNVGRYIQSSNYDAATKKGWQLGVDANGLGYINSYNGNFGGALTAATGTFSGSLTADAVNAVSTINLAGNAVTVPGSAYTDVEYGWHYGVGWITIQSVAVSAPGGVPFHVHAVAQIFGDETTIGNSLGFDVDVRLLCDATVIYEHLGVDNSPNFDAKEYNDRYAHAMSYTPAGGTRTFYLQIRNPKGYSNGEGHSRINAKKRSLLVLGTKR